MPVSRTRSSLRRQHWRMAWRETLILLKEFRQPLLIFLVAILGLGLLYHSMTRQTGESLYSLPEAVYLMLTLAFLQPSGNFPHNGILQIFYFLLPVIGIITLAQELAAPVFAAAAAGADVTNLISLAELGGPDSLNDLLREMDEFPVIKSYGTVKKRTARNKSILVKSHKPARLRGELLEARLEACNGRKFQYE